MLRNPMGIDFGDNDACSESEIFDAEGMQEEEWRKEALSLSLLLRTLRLEKKLTHQNMSKLMGVSLSSYKKYEAGETLAVPATALQQLINALGIEPSRVLVGFRPSEGVEAMVDDVLTLQFILFSEYRREQATPEFGPASLTMAEAKRVIAAVLRAREFKRWYSRDPNAQYDDGDIYEAVFELTNYYRRADGWLVYDPEMPNAPTSE